MCTFMTDLQKASPALFLHVAVPPPEQNVVFDGFKSGEKVMKWVDDDGSFLNNLRFRDDS